MKGGADHGSDNGGRAPARGPSPGDPASGSGRTLRSEWTKIKSVRSTYYSLVAMLVVCIGISAAIAAATAAQWSRTSAADKATFDPTQTSLGGMVFFGELVIVVLGTLIITSEFSTGMIRTSLTVMPRRPVIYAAKAIVLVLVALVVSFAAAFASFYLGQALLTNTHHTAMLSQPGVMRAVIGSALYTTLCGVFAYGVATLLRNAAATISSVIGVLSSSRSSSISCRTACGTTSTAGCPAARETP